MKVKELENTVKEMVEKIDQLEVKLKNMESKCAKVIETKKAATKIVYIKKVQNQKGIFKDKKKKNRNQNMMSLNLKLCTAVCGKKKLQQIKSNLRKKKNQINIYMRDLRLQL